MFALAFALLLSHELDAMIRNEWLFFPGLNALDPDTAAAEFNLLHVPLAAPIIWVLARGADRYEFEPPVETTTVYGAAAASAIHLGVLGRSSLARSSQARRHP